LFCTGDDVTKHTIAHRFSEFVTLHATLSAPGGLRGLTEKFPVSKMSYLMGEALKKDRVSKLHDYLNSVLAAAVTSTDVPVVLRDFLALPGARKSAPAPEVDAGRFTVAGVMGAGKKAYHDLKRTTTAGGLQVEIDIMQTKIVKAKEKWGRNAFDKHCAGEAAAVQELTLETERKIADVQTKLAALMQRKADVSPPDRLRMLLIVPQGLAPGENFSARYTVPEGREGEPVDFEATVPDGATPGTPFLADVYTTEAKFDPWKDLTKDGAGAAPAEASASTPEAAPGYVAFGERVESDDGEGDGEKVDVP
jgi:hypothetical protein